MSGAIGSYDFKEVEESILKFWKSDKIREKAKEKNKGKVKWYFLDGPPYTSGHIHVGQAWNKALKDAIMRYKRMRGFDVWDRACYDMHGLPTARKVQAELKLKDKDAILKFGMENFINECIKYSEDKAKIMNDDFTRLGVWMDFENSYKPITNSSIESTWWLVKKAHENKRLYEGLRTMQWCAHCQTALAKHECNYKEITDQSIFVKYPIVGKDNEFLIIWTTTPWTLAFNLAVMVNPELDYVKAEVDGEIWIVAKALAGPFIQSVVGKDMRVVEEFKGSKLEGVEYSHPWSKEINFAEIKKSAPKTHTVLLSEEYVDASAGTGLVHCAPGCGPEDYEIGHRNGLPAFNLVDQSGKFPLEMGKFARLYAKKDDKKFTEFLKKDGYLIASTPVEHDYAHCERCNNPVIFRTTKQWFFKIEDLKDKMLEANKKIPWVPIAAKHAFTSWLTNLRDNSITKQRYWGTPVPIWKCVDCDKYSVIGSLKELEKLAKAVPKNLHKPWIDEVIIPCDCGGERQRIPDILDVWIDAGVISWASINYPQEDKLFNDLYPADFIIEGKDQIRGWFNLLMVASMVAFEKPAFKAVYMHGFISDIEGEKMSKTLGNVISPYEVIDKHGADTLRYYTTSTNAGVDINFTWDEIALKQRNLIVLWNVHKYVIDFFKQNDLKMIEYEDTKKNLDVEENYMLSKTFSTVKTVTEKYETYELDSVPSLCEDLFLELSRTYIQLTRDKSNTRSQDEKQAVFYTMYTTLLNGLKIFAPTCPMITEKIFQNMKNAFDLKSESIHLYDWPEIEASLLQPNLESKMETAKQVIQAILSSREKAHLGVRWPIGEVTVTSRIDSTRDAIKELESLIKNQTNVKKITVLENFDKIRSEIKADFTKMGPEFGEKSPKIIAQLTTNSAESIFNKIEAEGKFNIIIDGETFEIKKEHLLIKREVPEPYIEGIFRGGFTYLDTTRNDELDGEGYAREIMRRVQVLRKNAGLEKADSISLFIKVDSAMKIMLSKWSDAIQEKVGATKVLISDLEPSKPKHDEVSKEKIKGKEVEIRFDKK